jgi:hypothetical protein
VQRRDTHSRTERVSTRYVSSRDQGLSVGRKRRHRGVGVVSSGIVCARLTGLRVWRLLVLVLRRVGILLLLLLMGIRGLLLRIRRRLLLLLLSVPESPGIESRLWGTGRWREHHAILLRACGRRARWRWRELHRRRVGHGRWWRHVLLLRLLLLLLLLLAQNLIGSRGRYMARLAGRIVGRCHGARRQVLGQRTSRGVLGIGEVFGMGKGTGARTGTARTWLDGRVRRICSRRRGP